MHGGDLPRRTAKADEAELQPEQEGLPEADFGRFGLWRGGIGGCQDRTHDFDPFSKDASSPSKILPASTRSWSSSRMVSRRPARVLSMPTASGGCTPPTSRKWTKVPMRCKAGVSKPKIASSTSKLTRAPTWVKAAPSK